MDRLLPPFSFIVAVWLAIFVAVSHAALPSEVYWNEILPHTLMPSVIRDHLHQGKSGIHVDTRKVRGGASPESRIITYYSAAATDYELHHLPDVVIYFLENDLHPEAKLNLSFTKATPAAFLPRGAANTIPFSTSKLSYILNHFAIAPGSPDAKAVKDTLNQCEAPEIKGEDKYCATSLESMVDFTTSKLGTHVRVVLTTMDKVTKRQQYTIGSGVQKMGAPKSVACHEQAYVYAVYYCHEVHDTAMYIVPLVGQDGTSVEAVAVCHHDTSGWNPKHYAFNLLKVKPGSIPICHFLHTDHLVWVPN
ncbi:BURP domain-containing protein 3-like isoform X2 [Tasmannia lanceolata]|uniref:BURP domain-containing protein 3-like isoform X2 n=1 Tax=Tasmannia lanceolata TaxID=3420 RepID=UPI0040635141